MIADIHVKGSTRKGVRLHIGVTKSNLTPLLSCTKRSPYSVIFLGKIACRYVVFELPDDYLELAQALLVGYFEKLEKE